MICTNYVRPVWVLAGAVMCDGMPDDLTYDLMKLTYAPRMYHTYSNIPYPEAVGDGFVCFWGSYEQGAQRGVSGVYNCD